MPVKQSATLDSSFWINAYRAGLLPYVLARYRLFYAPAVAGEIKLEFASGRQFWTLVAEGVLAGAVPQVLGFTEYGEGERAAITLALEHRDWVLLIDDRRPLVAAQKLGVTVVCTPVLVVRLFAEGALTLSKTLEALNELARLHTVSPALLTAAAGQLEILAREQRRTRYGDQETDDLRPA